jgi:hypothetical protein
MIEVDSNHCQIVKDSISGERAVDEQTFASLAILNERLERLRKLDKIFDKVAFSPAVEKFKKQKSAVAIS